MVDTSEKSIGSFLLLNPGKSEPLNEKQIAIDETGYVEAKVDSTMKQAARIVERLHDGMELDGRVPIYNLFGLRNTAARQAIAQFEVMEDHGLIHPLESIEEVSALKLNPWTCVGWGINSEEKGANLSVAKVEWMKSLKEAGVPVFGLPHPNGTDYYHIRPHLETDQLLIVDDLVKFYKELVIKL